MARLISATAVEPQIADSTRKSEDGHMPRERLGDIDRAKAFTIILVVLGHLVAREPPADNEWYLLLQYLIYSFHMPFFIYLAGVVFFYAGNETITTWPGYGRYLLRRAERLLVPFVLFGVVVVCGKLLARSFLHVDNSSETLLGGLIGLVWDTGHSPAESVWFIFVLFVYCMLTPLLLMLTGGRVWPLIVIAAVAYLLALPQYIYVDRVAHYYLFFLIGAVGQELPIALEVIDRGFVIFLGLFIGTLVLLALGIVAPVSYALCNLLALPALHGLARRGWFGRSQFLLWLSQYVFVIYLLNTIFIGVSKGVLLKFAPWDGSNFLLFAPVLMTVGLFGPIVTKELVFHRIRLLDRMTR